MTLRISIVRPCLCSSSRAFLGVGVPAQTNLLGRQIWNAIQACRIVGLVRVDLSVNDTVLEAIVASTLRLRRPKDKESEKKPQTNPSHAVVKSNLSHSNP